MSRAAKVLIIAQIFTRTCEGQILDSPKPLSLNYANLISQLVEATSLQCETINGFRRNILENAVNPERLRILFYKPKISAFHTYPLLNASDVLFKSDDFDTSLKTIIYVHGFNGFSQSRKLLDLGRHLAERWKYNLITLDTSDYTNSLDYVYVAGLTPNLGRWLYVLISELHKMGVSAENLHLVGHSMGAHVSGHAGRQFRSEFGQSLARITGLDPASPCFAGKEKDLSLMKGDAQYVDVIRTSLLSHRKDRLGHAEFYVVSEDGGGSECFQDDVVCLHELANTAFFNSVEDERRYLGRKCTNIKKRRCDTSTFALMGFGSSPKSRGSYLVETRLSM